MVFGGVPYYIYSRIYPKPYSIIKAPISVLVTPEGAAGFLLRHLPYSKIKAPVLVLVTPEGASGFLLRHSLLSYHNGDL